MTDSIARALSGRRLLLVLDNCEHVLDAAADLVDTILARTATVKVIATSREGLRVAGRALVAGPVARRAGRGELGGGRAVRGTRPGGEPGFELDEPPQADGGDGDLPAPGRHPSGDRAGGGPDGVDEPPGCAGPSR